jgi:signal transduction histidine kinase
VTADDDRIEALTSAAEALAGELDLDVVLERIVEAGRRLTGARFVALGEIGDDQQLIRFVHSGMDAATVARIGPQPAGKGLLGLLIRDPAILRLEDLSRHPASAGFPDGHPPMQTFLGAPIRSGGTVYGNLYLTEKPGGFVAADEAWIGVLAATAGAAVENAMLSRRLRTLAVQQERDRISRDLHDGIIQTLFSIGMNLESASALVDTAPARAQERMRGAVDRIDDAIRELRNTIFHLRPHAAATLGLRDGLVELAREHEVNALVRADLDLDRDLDAFVPEAMVPDVLQVVREALSNVARHARAGTVGITAAAHGTALRVEVVDDGVGFEPTGPAVGRGLENVRERAHVLRGDLVVESTPGVGTRIALTVPLFAAPPKEA